MRLVHYYNLVSRNLDNPFNCYCRKDIDANFYQKIVSFAIGMAFLRYFHFINNYFIPFFKFCLSCLTIMMPLIFIRLRKIYDGYNNTMDVDSGRQSSLQQNREVAAL